MTALCATQVMRDVAEITVPGTEEDASLVVASRRGDRDAFVTLYDRYIERIEGYVRYRVTEGAEVEDLVSTTFERALAHLDRYDPARGSFGAWLFAIARNAVHNYHRALARALPEQPAPPTSIEDPVAAALQQERAHTVRRAISTLSRDQQDALALRYGADLPFAQVAASMGRTDAAAKMLVQRALASLRRQLSEEDLS